MGVMNGEATPVAIMLLPAGRCTSMGRATHSNTWFWKGNRQANRIRSAATECSSRRRSSRRWAISVGLMRGSPVGGAPRGGPASGVVTLHRGLGRSLRYIRGGLRGLAALQAVAHRRRGAPHLLGGEFTFQLLVEIAEHGPSPSDPEAHAAREPRQALRPEDHERQHEDERKLPEATLEHGSALCQCLSLFDPSALPPA